MKYDSLVHFLTSGCGAGVAVAEGAYFLAGLFSLLFLLSMLSWVASGPKGAARKSGNGGVKEI